MLPSGLLKKGVFWIRDQFLLVVMGTRKWEVKGDTAFHAMTLLSLYGHRFPSVHYHHFPLGMGQPIGELLLLTMACDHIVSKSKPGTLPRATSFWARLSLDFRGRTGASQDEMS